MDNKNETSYSRFIKKKNITKKENENNKGKKKNIFLSKTFASKLFLKLTAKIIDPIIVCLQTLKFEPENRKKEEIENTIPYLKTLENFKNYIYFRENEQSSFNLMVKFAKITYYQYYRKNTILKRAGSYNDKFYVILNGTIDKYTLIFEKLNMTIEQYLYYLIKMDIICEKEIIKKCHILNKTTMNKIGIAGEQSILKYFNVFMKRKYNDTLTKVKKELIENNINNDLFNGKILRRISSIDKYIKMIDCNTSKNVIYDGEPKFGLWIGKYKLTSILTKGYFFNNLTDENIKDNNMYYCRTNCDMGQIGKDDFIEDNLNVSIQLKMENLFKEIKNDFFFFRGINDNKFISDYSHFMLYKKYKKGDKIFIQGGIYEGIYLIYNGEITLSTKTNIDKLGQLLINVIYSIKTYSEHIPAFNSKELIEEFNNKHKLLYTRGDFPIKELINEKIIEITTIKKNDVLGLCDLYDHKTEIFNFTAECVSDEAELIFISKNNFNLLIGRELPFYEAILPMIEYKIQFIAGKLRSFSEQTLKIYQGKRKKIKEIKNNSTSNIYSNDNKNNINKSKYNISIEKNNNSKYFTNKKENLSSRGKNDLSPLIINSLINTTKLKRKIGCLNKNNKNNFYTNLNNVKNESTSSSLYMPLLYKTINNKIFHSNSSDTDYLKYNSFKGGYVKQQFMSNDSLFTNHNSSRNICNATHSRIIKNNKLVNNFIEKIEEKRKNDICFPSFCFKKKKIYQYEKQRAHDQRKVFPILEKKYLNNLELKKLIYN